MKLLAAPLQGFTEAPWRNLHHELFGGIDTYYTPFVRLERGEFRRRDVRDIEPARNTVPHLVPQLIAATPAELDAVAGLFVEQGYAEADLNLGCPFPLLTGKHKGAGILSHPEEVKALLTEMKRHPDLRFSVKMRLGLVDADEWKSLLPLLNEAPLQRITLHPRIGKQQYKGQVHLDVFAAFYEQCQHPLVYNGDLRTLEDMERMAARFPRLEGLMLGRGLLAQPSLAVEFQEGRAWTAEERLQRVLQLHDRLLQHYEACLQGDAQLLAKLKPFWEYLLPEADHKAKKAIHKATSLNKYRAAVRLLG